MSLEKTIQKIEQIKINQGIVSLSPIEISSVEIFEDLKDPLILLILSQRSFYLDLERLYKWGKSEISKPSDYGVNAQAWLDNQLTCTQTNSSLISQIKSRYHQYRTNSLKQKPDTLEYIDDLAEFYTLGDFFNRENFDVFENSINNYIKYLNRFDWVLKKQGYSQDDISILNSESDKLNKFKGEYKSIIKKITQCKKGPLTNNRKIIEDECKTKLDLIDLESLKSMITDCDNLPKLLTNYIIGPKLVVLK